MIHVTSMRLAFERATQGTPRTARTATYAMVKSALSRRLGTRRPKTNWSVTRRAKR